MKKRSGLADSPFFQPASPAETAIKVFNGNETPSTETDRTEKRTEVRAEKRSVERSDLPIKRRTKRYSFEFYDDQLLKLKQLKHQAEMRGERLSQSDMVREALDQYLRDR